MISLDEDIIDMQQHSEAVNGNVDLENKPTLEFNNTDCLTTVNEHIVELEKGATHHNEVKHTQCKPTEKGNVDDVESVMTVSPNESTKHEILETSTDSVNTCDSVASCTSHPNHSSLKSNKPMILKIPPSVPVRKSKKVQIAKSPTQIPDHPVRTQSGTSRSSRAGAKNVGCMKPSQPRCDDSSALLLPEDFTGTSLASEDLYRAIPPEQDHLLKPTVLPLTTDI